MSHWRRFFLCFLVLLSYRNFCNWRIRHMSNLISHHVMLIRPTDKRSPEKAYQKHNATWTTWVHVDSAAKLGCQRCTGNGCRTWWKNSVIPHIWGTFFLTDRPYILFPENFAFVQFWDRSHIATHLVVLARMTSSKKAKGSVVSKGIRMKSGTIVLQINSHRISDMTPYFEDGGYMTSARRSLLHTQQRAVHWLTHWQSQCFAWWAVVHCVSEKRHPFIFVIT